MFFHQLLLSATIGASGYASVKSIKSIFCCAILVAEVVGEVLEVMFVGEDGLVVVQSFGEVVEDEVVEGVLVAARIDEGGLVEGKCVLGEGLVTVVKLIC